MNKNILVLLYLHSFIIISTINIDNNPKDKSPKWKNPEIFSEIIESNQNIFLLQEEDINLCSFIKSVEKYIYTLNGTEIYSKSKIKNKGKEEKCIIKIDKKNKIISISDIKIEEEGVNINYFINETNTKDIEITVDLQSSKEVIISYKLFETFSQSIFYKYERVTLNKNTKYIFTAKQPFEIIGTEYGYLKEKKQKNGAIYLYYNENTYNFYDYIILSVYGIKFKSELQFSLHFTLGRKLHYIKIPNLYEFGNNKITSNKIISNLKPDEYNYENDKVFITLKSSERYRNFEFTFIKEFEAKLTNDWIMDGAVLYNTCTEKIRKKANEILTNSNSKEKDYKILGNWIYNNIKYDINYVNSDMTVDEILENKVGVCAHMTRLYNSFLNCIGIKAIYTKGYAQTKNDSVIDLNERHAWTVAKIDDKWIPLDSTWGMFNGKLPIGHIFKYFGDYYRDTEAEWGFFSGKMNKNYEKNHINRILSDSNPEINEKLSVVEILSREKDDDDIDIDLDIEKDNILFIIIIIIIISIIVIGICIKGKKTKKDEYELYN